MGKTNKIELPLFSTFSMGDKGEELILNTLTNSINKLKAEYDEPALEEYSVVVEWTNRGFYEQEGILGETYYVSCVSINLVHSAYTYQPEAINVNLIHTGSNLIVPHVLNELCHLFESIREAHTKPALELTEVEDKVLSLWLEPDAKSWTVSSKAAMRRVDVVEILQRPHVVAIANQRLTPEQMAEKTAELSKDLFE